MRAVLLTTTGLALLLSACSTGVRTGTQVPTRTTTASTRAEPAPAPAEKKAAKGTPARGPRKLNGVPPGHMPKPGECRLWYSGKPPGQQPKPQSCASLRGRVPAGAFVLYGGNAYDADYDWAGEARRDARSVPDIIVDILRRRS